MSLDAIAALLGHKTLAMTMVYARIADKTVAEEYFAVTEKVEALYDQPRQLPADDEGTEMRKLRGEMHRRMLGNGYCARPVEMDCHFESICESCTFFVTTIEFRPTLQRNATTPTARARSAARRSSTASSTASTTRRRPAECSNATLARITRISTTRGGGTRRSATSRRCAMSDFMPPRPSARRHPTKRGPYSLQEPR